MTLKITLFPLVALLACTPSSSDDLPEDTDTDTDTEETGIEFECAPDPSAPVFEPGYSPSLWTVLPDTMDPDVDWHRPDVPFVVGLPHPDRIRNEVLVAFPGSGGSPERMQRLLTTASFAGYHVIGLAYSNGGSVTDMCKGPEAPACHGEVIEERLYGNNTSDKVTVNEDNSARGRLERLLDALHTLRPEHEWGQFMGGGELDWSKIAVAGHSQGGKVAAFLSSDVETARAVLLSATGSAFLGDDGEPFLAPWTLEPRATPPSRTFGLWHQGETANAYAPIILDSYAVNDFGPTVDVDVEEAPYQCTHKLRTATAPALNNPDDPGNCTEHSAVIADDCMALDAEGVALLTPAQLYMLTWEESR